jgi:hypothetical protein
MKYDGKNRIFFTYFRYIPILIFVYSLLFLNSLTYAQRNILENNTNSTIDTNIKKSDTLLIVIDTTIKISKEKIEHTVNYESKDSMMYDVKTKKLTLYNGAIITYDDITIKSGYISYQSDSNLLSAYMLAEEKNDTSKKPIFTKGDEASTFDTLQYNFKSERALVNNAHSAYGDGYIISEQIKRNKDESISGFRNIYTTCDLDKPHFGIATKKIKIIPNKVAVSANLIIAGVPTPIFLPFALFPLTKGQRSGFIIPTYENSALQGFGLREGGYYFAINNHMDMAVRADFYTLGTWRARNDFNYSYKYRFNGGLSIGYANNRIGYDFDENAVRDKSFNVRWNHTVDQNRMPGSSFSANVNFITSSRYNRFNSNNLDNYLNNTYTSSISYAKSWKNRPFNFNVSANHQQNTQTGLVNLSLPNATFSVNQFYPLRFKKDVIKPRWYEKINSSYRVEAINNLSFTDSTFSLRNLTARNFQNGIRHTIPLGTNFTLLEFINGSISANYNEYWYSNSQFKYYNFADRRIDTIRKNGFFTARDYGISSSLSTRIYGIKLFKHGAIKGIRHVITPALSFNYNPDFSKKPYNYYYETFLDTSYNKRLVSYYEGSINGTPGAGKSGTISFSVDNNLQLKLRGKNPKDSTNKDRKINLIDGLSANTGYNLAVDSFNWLPVNVSYRTTLFENISLRGGANFEVYDKDTLGRLVKQTLYQNKKGIAKFRRADMSITGRLPIASNKKSTDNISNEQRRAIGNINDYADFNIPWSMNFTLNAGVQKNFDPKTRKDTLDFNQNITINGDLNITDKWKIGYNTGYDFKQKQVRITTLSIYRDLHCWEIAFNITPFGGFKNYDFTLRPKSGVLQDLKLVKRKPYQDNF